MKWKPVVESEEVVEETEVLDQRWQGLNEKQKSADMQILKPQITSTFALWRGTFFIAKPNSHKSTSSSCLWWLIVCLIVCLILAVNCFERHDRVFFFYFMHFYSQKLLLINIFKGLKYENEPPKPLTGWLVHIMGYISGFDPRRQVVHAVLGRTS